jgi:hypothetical protein
MDEAPSQSADLGNPLGAGGMDYWTGLEMNITEGVLLICLIAYLSFVWDKYNP